VTCGGWAITSKLVDVWGLAPEPYSSTVHTRKPDAYIDIYHIGRPKNNE